MSTGWRRAFCTRYPESSLSGNKEQLISPSPRSCDLFRFPKLMKMAMKNSNKTTMLSSRDFSLIQNLHHRLNLTPMRNKSTTEIPDSQRWHSDSRSFASRTDRSGYSFRNRWNHDRCETFDAFSAIPKRLLPLRRMTPQGQRMARWIVDRLVPVAGNGTTSVGDALRKATTPEMKLLVDCGSLQPP
ncbi:unnamed protein product [Lupinus luteus]|uniref:Uncharacterized protein n=1 Tax=Lupinus luteus TaxID=3873 RepID=A0AAV1W7N7_LUPLU